MNNLEKPTELAFRLGLPVSVIRRLIRSRQLEHVFVTPGKRNPLIPAGAWDKFVEASKVRSVLDDQSAKGSGNELNSIKTCPRAMRKDASGSISTDKETSEQSGAQE